MPTVFKKFACWAWFHRRPEGSVAFADYDEMDEVQVVDTPAAIEVDAPQLPTSTEDSAGQGSEEPMQVEPDEV